MAKVVGFDADVANNQEQLKRANQRALSVKQATRHIHFSKDTVRLPNPVLVG